MGGSSSEVIRDINTVTLMFTAHWSIEYLFPPAIKYNPFAFGIVPLILPIHKFRLNFYVTFTSSKQGGWCFGENITEDYLYRIKEKMSLLSEMKGREENIFWGLCHGPNAIVRLGKMKKAGGFVF